jgi:hypothetical protein
MELTPVVSDLGKQSVCMDKSRATDASVAIAASFFTDDAYQATH